MPVLISPQYSSLSLEAVQAASALSEQKMLTLISDAAWLEEGFSARSYNGEGSAMGNRACFNHCGGGSGAYLRTAHTIGRGILRDPAAPQNAVTVAHSDDFRPLAHMLWSFEAASDFSPKPGGANWRLQKGVPFLLHRYAACLRWRVAVKRSGGTGALHLRLAVYESPAAEPGSRLDWSGVVSTANNAWQVCELSFDLDSSAELARLRGEDFPKLRYAALLARSDAGSSFLVGDNMGGLVTWPGFAVCSL